jgi:hypothetical protein
MMCKQADDNTFRKHFVNLNEIHGAFVSVSVAASAFADQELP